jgi:hypothetical protein
LTTGTSLKVAKVPEPHLRPEEKPAVTPAASTPAPTVGTVVKKKFIWPGGDNPSNGNGSAGQSL